MTEKLEWFKKIIVDTLLLIMSFIVVLSVIRLALRIMEEVFNPPFLMLNLNQLQMIFGFFLMVLIGLELLDSIKAYLSEEILEVEVVLSIALIAVARKIVTLDFSQTSDFTLIGIGIMIFSLSAGYYLIKKSY